MTIINKKDLWLRLRSYHFDHIVDPGLWESIKAKFGGTDASEKAFAVKIAAKHGWKNRFALKAIAEYKKFIYLGIISDFLVTPSKVIDVVWHEHILFSKAYRIFCADVIEQNFDHHPELIPMAGQTGRFNAQYQDTLNLYQTEFNTTPAPDIWGDTKFDKERLSKEAYQSTKKKRNNNRGDGGEIIVYGDAQPLHCYFDDNENHPEFGGGEYGGGGASGDWGDTSSNDSGSDGGGGGCSGGCGGGGD